MLLPAGSNLGCDQCPAVTEEHINLRPCGFGFGYLIGWLEAALLVVMSDAEFARKYNEREPGSSEFVFTGR